MKYCDLIGAAVQFTDMTRPFYSERRQVIKKSERRKRVGNARLAIHMAD